MKTLSQSAIKHITGIFSAALISVLLLVSSSSHAASPTTGQRWFIYGNPAGFSQPVGFVTGQDACDAYKSYRGSTSAYAFNGNQCIPTPWNGAAPNVELLSATYCLDGTAPNTALPLAQQCADLAPTCPVAGTDAGIQNITSGWINSADYAAAKVIDSPRPSTVIVDSCKVSIGAPVECYQSLQPTASGLYRLSCDFRSKYTGENGTVGPDTPALQPSPLAPPCPGTSGEINGKPVCLAPTVPATPLPKLPQPGNPSTGSADAPKSYDPSTGAGSSSPVGSAGVGGGATVAVSGGGGGNVTVNIPDIAVCGTPNNPPCKIDETGTPTDGVTAFTAANTALDAAVSSYTDKLAEVAGDADKDVSWGWVPTFPQATCTPIQFAALGEVNWCNSTSAIEEVMTFLWSFVTVFCLIGMTSRAIKGQ